MNGFIAAGFTNDDTKFYITNTNPILWNVNLPEAKVFDSEEELRNELEDSYIFLASTIVNTNIHSIWILEYKNHYEVRRVKYL